MITDSYSASCFIESKDGQYHMECEMISGDKEAYSDYDGTNFIGGLNQIMDDLTIQMLEEPEPEPEFEPLTQEERIEYLEGLVKDLRDEKADLINRLNENDKVQDDSANNVTKHTDKYLNNYEEEYNDLFNNWIDTYSNVLHWPFKITYYDMI